MNVETRTGAVSGLEEDGLVVFRGIPYAARPIGERRWRPPAPVEPWTGVRDAHEFGPIAPQLEGARGTAVFGDPTGQDEDCLTLNVWTPGVDGSKRPVMVWLHGGAFVGGSGGGVLYRGDSLARRGDVVVVTINYRLGVLGYLGGNWGLLDQIAALEWVRDNIAGFGGDPGNVTVFGESAGGMSVAVLLGTPRAAGLFHKAIVQSGAAAVATEDRAAEVAAGVYEHLGQSDLDQLRAVPVDDILEAQAEALRPAPGRPLPFRPMLDGDVLPRHPLDEIADGLSADVPVLIGTNRDEWKFFGIADVKARDLDDAGLARRLSRTLGDRGDDVLERYRKAREARGAAVTPSELWFAIESDRIFRAPSMELAAVHAAHQPATYSYLFTWESPAIGGVLGSCHALEIPFVFGTLANPVVAAFTGEGPAARHLSEQMQDAWLTFAATGDPAVGDLDPWPAYDARRRATMVLGKECWVEDAPFEDERAVWDDVGVRGW
jgi:para-nitrobenzyl esterase